MLAWSAENCHDDVGFDVLSFDRDDGSGWSIEMKPARQPDHDLPPMMISPQPSVIPG